MYRPPLHWLRHPAFIVATATLLAACADDAPMAPDRGAAGLARRMAANVTAQPAAVEAVAASAGDQRAAELGVCQNLRPPAGSKLAFRVYANGVQIYHWNGSGWSFDGPSAVLTADAAGHSTVGTHYAGPTWESASGGKVIAALVEPCSPDPDAIPWLLLRAVRTEGGGIFHRVTYIQRVNTVGGKAPSAPGSFAGQEARVPYTTEYLFYRAQ